MADAYAALGYYCIIPDFFNDTQPPADLMGDLNKMEDKESTIGHKLYTYGRMLYNFPKFLILNSQTHSINMVKSLIPYLKERNTKVGVQGKNLLTLVSAGVEKYQCTLLTKSWSMPVLLVMQVISTNKVS